MTSQQVVTRALYLAGQMPIDALDPYVRRDPATLRSLGGYVLTGLDSDQHHTFVPDLYYLLKDFNGGKDPTAPDPADRWSRPGSSFVNRTVDCSGGNAWMQGFDRYQPRRFDHIYGGWINTDSKILDARGPARCFRALERPEPGCILTCKSGSRGHVIGHECTVVAYRGAEWDPTVRDLWALIDVVDCAASGRRANSMRNAVGWWNTGAMFLSNVMEPDIESR